VWRVDRICNGGKRRLKCRLKKKKTKWRFSRLLGPPDVKHFQVVLDNADLFFLMGLVKVFQYDGYVHVDDDHVANYDETGKVRDGENRMPAIAVRKARSLDLAIRRLHH